MHAQAEALSRLFAELWSDYGKLSPPARRIHALFAARGETVVNDHIALRTFRRPGMGLAQVAAPFEALGYEAKGEYFFETKKLYAKHWEHPDVDLPKIFISELEVEKMPPVAQSAIAELADQVDPKAASSPGFFVSGRPWSLSHETYLELAKVSEYASWVAAYGFRPNHFTVLINRLKTFQSLQEVNAFLEANGVALNLAGGKIKGEPADLLEQSSTLADEIPVRFSDGEFPVPSVYYEFARRYAGADGKIYQGFVAKSADKIFESTDRVASGARSR